MKTQPSPWQIASIIGSVWGAFEIVAGSLLHNLAVPTVAGTVLSALGVVIMVTGARVFGGKGIFWRSALVCAALKTVSPSPVILSPMIGITLEGLLMELGTLLLGNGIAGYLLGGGLAVLSILGFKLVRLIMIYGTDLVEAYRSVFSFAFSNEVLSTKGYLIPILILVLIYLAIGAFAALTGYRGGNSIRKKYDVDIIQLLPPQNRYMPTVVKGYKGGVGFLLFHIAWLIIFIFTKNYIPPVYWLSGGAIYLLLCLYRYGRVRRLMSRPTFWIAIVMVSILSSVFITLGKHNSFILSTEFFMQILAILIRASVVIISFSCISIELMSKGVSRHFQGKLFSPLATSYIQAHGALPQLLTTLKGGSRKIFQPIPLIERMFSQFTHQQHKAKNQHPIYIVSADRHAGKTTFIKEIIAWLENQHIPIAGFISEGLWDAQGNRSGFNLITFPQKKSQTLCDRISASWEKHESYYFNPTAVEMGKQALLNAPAGAVVIIDEVGRFELDGKLWADALSEIISRNQNPIIIAVRTPFVNEVMLKWNLSNVKIIDATTDCPEEVAKTISSV